MNDTSITIAIDEHTLEALHLLADLDDLSPEECARRLLSSAASQAAGSFRAFVQEGLDAANRGELIPHEEVFRQIRERRALRNAA